MPVGDWPDDPGAATFLHDIAEMALLPETPARIAVAVSGGSDSMALLHVMASLARRKGWVLCAVTVDHALRPEAAAEALGVARVCADLGLSHSTLRWDHGPVTGNLMDAARRARYALMAGWARGQAVTHVLLGHTADDQAETFLMGLAREAGLDGLLGMRAAWDQDGVRFLRPFLGVGRDMLRDYLGWQGVAWVDDPTNADDRFTRVKARRALKALKPLGITVEKLTGTMTNLSEAQGAVEDATRAAFARICSARGGEAVFDRKEWRKTGAEVQRRLLVAGLRWVAGPDHAPRGSGVVRVRRNIDEGRDSTLAGCRVRVSADAFRVAREPKAVAGLTCATTAVWDGRWSLEGPHDPGLAMRALGAEGLRLCKDWRGSGHSRDALLVSPAIWRGAVLVAAPLAGFGTEWRARIVAPFQCLPVSH